MWVFLIFLIYIADQASKFYILRYLSSGTSVVVLDGILDLTLVKNTGAAFGMFRGNTWIFAFIAFITIIFIILLLFIRGRYMRSLEKTALVFILSGAAGNLTDRILYGYVVDFIDIGFWPVFNLADSFISAGAVLLFTSLFFDKRAFPGGM